MNGVRKVKIRLNGKDRDFSGSTVEDLLLEHKLEPDSVAVERNGEIVHRDIFAQVQMVEGDVIEIVRFVGGG